MGVGCGGEFEDEETSRGRLGLTKKDNGVGGFFFHYIFLFIFLLFSFFTMSFVKVVLNSHEMK